MGFKLFAGWKAKRDRDTSALQEPQPENLGPPEELDIERPLDALSVGFMFPLAFQVGAVPIRARVLRLLAGTKALAAKPGSLWFFWKAETAAGVLSAYWELAGVPAEGEAALTWDKTARTLATAAAIQIKAALAARPQTFPTSFSAGPCPAPVLGAQPVLRADFRYAARGVYREGSAYASIRYPQLITRALGGAAALNAEDAIGTMLSLSAALRKESPNYWADRAFTYPAARGGQYLPLYELLNLLSDKDAQLVIQNNLIIKTPGAALGALFMYRGQVQTPAGMRERVVAPHSFDPQRIYPYLPASVFDDGRLAGANAAVSAEDFLLRNDEAYEGLFQALQKDALSLSPDGAALIRDVYLNQVYSVKRQAFDALVLAGQPFNEFKKLPEATARRAVDTSATRAIAASVFGSKEAQAFVYRWCSRRKQEAIAEEIGLLDSLLKEGQADINVIMRERNALNDRAAAILEANALEAASRRQRGIKP